MAEASRRSHEADLLLIGDSSCLMNVSAVELGEALPPGRLDTKRYYRLLDRAMQTVLDPCRPLLVPERLL